MINIPCVSFTVFGAFNILCLALAGFILKKYLIRFPNKLIPILNVFASIVITCIYGVLSNHVHLLYFYIFIGMIYGLASVGLHQMVKQTRDYFKLKKYMKDRYIKEGHTISMSD